MANDIDPHLCTHIMHSFAKIKGGVIATTEWNDAKILRDLTNLKRKNPKLKILVAIGGWTFGVKLFTEIGSTRKHRAVFIESAIRFVRRHRLDGIDLDWEYPAHRKSPATDKQKFTLLCQELREAIDQEKLTSGRNRLLLTAAVGASKSIAHTAYEISEISQSLDFINLLTYDFYGYYNGETGHHAALVGTLEQPNSVQAAVEYWISQGAPTNKLVLGLGTYGRTYTLSHAVDNGLKASVSGAGNPGKYTKEKGVLAYYEICSLDDLTVIEAKDSPVQASYGYVGTQWIAFDNTASMLLKVDFAKDQGLRGVMFWTLDLDDFKGKFCKAGKYPLMNAVKKRLESSEPPLTSVKPSPLKIQHTAPKKKQQPLIVQRPKAPTKQILQPLGMKNKSGKYSNLFR